MGLEYELETTFYEKTEISMLMASAETYGVVDIGTSVEHSRMI